MPAYSSDEDEDIDKYEYDYNDPSETQATLEFDEIHPASFHSSFSAPAPLITTMPYRTKLSPGMVKPRKMAMFVKKPKPETDLGIDGSSITLEGELTNFLAMANLNGEANKPPIGGDDGTMSTTSRTTKSSVGSHANNSNNNNNNISTRNHHHSVVNEDEEYEAQHERSLGSRIAEPHSERVTNHNDWDWSHQSNDWMNFESSRNGSSNVNHNGNCIDTSLSTRDVFPELEGSEHIRGINDSLTDNGESGNNGSLTTGAFSPLVRRNSGGRRPSRRMQKQQEMQNSVPMARRLGERSRSGGHPSNRSSDEDESHHNHHHSSSSSHRHRSSSRHGPSKSSHGRRSKSRSGCESRITESSTATPSKTNRRRSLDGSRRRGSHGASVSTHARMQHSHHRSKSRSKTNRSSSPTRRRRMSGAKPQTQRRSRSIDGASMHSAASEGTTPYSNQSRRGRRRSSLNNSSHSNDSTMNNSMGNSDASNWVNSTSSHQEAHQQKQTQSMHIRGRQGRRSSMTNATLVVEEQRQKHSRGKSASIRTSRRRSTGEESDNEYTLNNSSHHCSIENISSHNHNHITSDSRIRSSSSSKQQTSNRTRSRSSHRRSSHTSSKSKHTNPNGSMDRSNRSNDSNDIVPERLTKAIDRSTSHRRGSHESQLERAAPAIFVAEDGEDLVQNVRDAVENLPSHMLDPSNVPLSLHW